MKVMEGQPSQAKSKKKFLSMLKISKKPLLELETGEETSIPIS